MSISNPLVGGVVVAGEKTYTLCIVRVYIIEDFFSPPIADPCRLI